MSESENEREGFTCECGVFHPFGVYVMAHYDESLTHTCDCGREHVIRSGRAILTKTPKAKKRND